jgi:hypothetical protein
LPFWRPRAHRADAHLRSLWPTARLDPGAQGGGTHDYWVKNFHDPSITVYLPSPEKATGAAVVVVPGGGHRLLVFKAEGLEPAEYLASLGVAAFALKYRLAREEGSTYSIEKDAKADAYRAMRLVRSRAAEPIRASGCVGREEHVVLGKPGRQPPRLGARRSGREADREGGCREQSNRRGRDAQPRAKPPRAPG